LCGQSSTSSKGIVLWTHPVLRHWLHPDVSNAPSLLLIVTVVGPVGFPLVMMALKSPLVFFKRAQ
jgi:hypothetical protein